MSLPDIQNERPNIQVSLNRVGVMGLKAPIFVSQKAGGVQHTSASINCFINLAANKKGINMSRLPSAIFKYLHQPLNKSLINDISENIRLLSNADKCELSYEFTYFLSKIAPVSKELGIVDYLVKFNGEVTETTYDFTFSVRVPCTSLCPCSKEISDGGAHNQRCYITLDVTPENGKFIWLEDMISLAESCASCEIYSVLKRSDEKFVTDMAYDNPKFVEDIARECYLKLCAFDNIKNFKIKIESDESIHTHKAVAILEK